MKMLFDFLPIALFFVAYKIWGIFVATGVAIVTSLIQVCGYWLKFRKTETMQLITLAAVALLGGATIFFHNETFIKWKPSVIYWIFGAIFVFTQFFGKKTLIQRIMAHQMTLPENIWRNVNLSWGIFFTLMGFANMYIAFHFSTDTWVNFKLFGALGCMLVFIVLQSLYMAKYMSEDETPKSN